MTESAKTDDIFVAIALRSWEQWFRRADKAFRSFSDEEMLHEIAPGKNRLAYIFGHLIALSDAIIPQLGLGELLYPDYRHIFIEESDRAVETPDVAELRSAWATVHERLSSHLASLTPEQWLERHATVSAEDFAREPHRNRYSILINRTAHLTYHLGQAVLAVKKQTAS